VEYGKIQMGPRTIQYKLLASTDANYGIQLQWHNQLAKKRGLTSKTMQLLRERKSCSQNAVWGVRIGPVEQDRSGIVQIVTWVRKAKNQQKVK